MLQDVLHLQLPPVRLPLIPSLPMALLSCSPLTPRACRSCFPTLPCPQHSLAWTQCHPLLWASCRWKVGTQPGLDDAQPEIALPAVPGQTDYTATFNATGVVLFNGHRYYVTLDAVNGACPEQKTSVISTPLLIDSTPPLPQTDSGRDLIFANSECNFHTIEQTDTDGIHACWYEFVELESEISSYEVGLLHVRDPEEVKASTGELGRGGQSLPVPASTGHVSMLAALCWQHRGRAGGESKSVRSTRC